MKYLYLYADGKIAAFNQKKGMPDGAHFIGTAADCCQARTLLAQDKFVQTICTQAMLSEFVFLTFEREEKHQFLSQYNYCTRELDRLAEEHKKTKERIGYKKDGLPDMFELPQSHQIAVDITNLSAIRTQIGRTTVKIEQLRQTILDTIDTVKEPILRQLLAYKYINALTSEQIAEQMHYDPRHIKRLQKKALLQVQLPASCRCLSPKGHVKMQSGLRTDAPSAHSL